MLRAAICPMRSATTQCSMRTVSPVARVGEARDVARGPHAGRAGPQPLVDDDAAVDRQPRRLGERDRRPDADAQHDEVGGEPRRRREHDGVRLDARRRLPR